MLQHIDSILENITIKKETEEEMKEEAREEKVLEREEDEVVVDERESDEKVGEADKSGAEDVHGEKSYPKRKAKYCRICIKMVINVGRHCRNVHQITYNQLTSKGKQKCPLCGKFVKFLKKHLKGAKHVLDGERVQELVKSLDGRRRENTAKSPEPTSPAFTWTACLQNFSAYLQTVDGRGKRADEAEKQKSILQRVVAHCNFSDLNAFSLDTYIEKHVKLLEESSCKPSTFIAHNAAMIAFIKFMRMKHAAACNFEYQATMIRIKQLKEFYRRRLHEQRYEIKGRDRRNAVQTEDVNRVLRSRYISICIRDMRCMVEHPGPDRMRAYGEVLFTIITFENAQRPSAVRGMLVEEAKVAEKAKKGYYVIRVLHHKTGLTCGPAQIVVRPPVMEALSSFVRVAEGQKYVFEWRGEQLTSSNAAKALQHVCAAALPKGRKLTATMVRKCTATQIRAKNPQQREMLAGHMAHLPSTQETHYINPLQSDESIIAFEAIQSLYGRDTIHEEAESSGCFRPEDIARCIHSDESHNSEEASPAEESATKTRDKTENLETVVLTADVRKYKSRRQFTEEENSEVKSYFAERIRNKQRIFIAEARAALEQGALSLCANKTAKQIQDRVAGFIRSAERREKCFDF